MTDTPAPSGQARRASDGRPDDPFNGQCPVDEVGRKYATPGETVTAAPSITAGRATGAVATARDGDTVWLVTAHGYWYRPAGEGYTASVWEAGVYAPNEAFQRMFDGPGVSVMTLSEVPLPLAGTVAGHQVDAAWRDGYRAGLEAGRQSVPSPVLAGEACDDLVAAVDALLGGRTDGPPAPVEMSGVAWAVGDKTIRRLQRAMAALKGARGVSLASPGGAVFDPHRGAAVRPDGRTVQIVDGSATGG